MMKKGFIFCLLSLFLFALPVRYVKAESMANVDVQVKAYFDEYNILTTNVNDQPYASKISASLHIPEAPEGYSSYQFFCWVVNGVVRQDLPADYEFFVRNTTVLTAIYRPSDRHAVLFMDSNGTAIKVDYVSNGEDATPPDVSSYSKPGMVVSSTSPWGEVSLTNITENKIAYLEYDFDTSETFNVTVVNGSGSNEAASYGSVLTAVANAPEGDLEFFHWTDENGKIVSHKPSYSFTAYKDTTITAVYENMPSVDIPYVVISDLLLLRDGKSTFIGQFNIPDGYTMVEYGFLAANTQFDFKLDTEGVIKYQSEKSNAQTNEYMISFPFVNGQSVKGYIVVKNALTGLLEYHYSSTEKISFLMISEYGEGSSYNKWIEIYNPTDEIVALSDYRVELYVNGATTASNPLSFTTESIFPGDVYVIAHPDSNADILSQSDVTSEVTNFNGDDAVALLKNYVVIDVIGVIGTDPGTKWDVGEGSTLDHTLVRKPSTDYYPNGAWKPSDWDVYDCDYIGNLGYHEDVEPLSISIIGATEVMKDASLPLAVMYNPINSIRGVEWESSNTSIATVNSNGLVTGVDVGEVTITARSALNGTILDTHPVTVTSPVYYSVSASSSDELKGSVSASPTSVLSGGSSTITISPATGYQASTITINSEEPIDITGQTSYLIENIFENKTVVVNFVEGITELVFSKTLTGTTGNPPSGWTYSGLGSAYKDGSLKMDTTGDYIISESFALQTSAILYIELKGNGFSGGSISFYDQENNLLKTFSTEIENLQKTLSFTISDTSVTSVKFVYNKSSGNVGIYSVELKHIVD
ncbi:MAG: lamin tail domain-containing protein [Candidatus Izemoplasmatales bacterium]